MAVALCRVVDGCECWGWWTCTCSWNFCTCAAPAPAPAPAPRPASGPAHDDSKCYEWGYPKAGKWQQDDDCCAGEEQAACAAGYRYDRKKECHRENKCVAYEYTCTKCDGAGCDTNYDINSEDGEDYDCYDHFMICWVLWPVAYYFLWISIQRVKGLISQGDESGAKELWAKRKQNPIQNTVHGPIQASAIQWKRDMQRTKMISATFFLFAHSSFAPASSPWPMSPLTR